MPYDSGRDDGFPKATHHIRYNQGGGRTKHGIPSLAKALKVLTTNKLPARSLIAREVFDWKEGVRQDRGSDLTVAQETILEGAAQQMLLRKALWGYLGNLLEKGELINDGMAPAVLADYDRIDSALNRNLQRLGLDRIAKDATVDSILNEIRERPHEPQETIIEATDSGESSGDDGGD